MSFLNWMSIIQNVPQLEVIKTNWKHSRMNDDGITGVMIAETNLRKVIFVKMPGHEYNIVKDMIGREWRFEDSIQKSIEEVTFIRVENDNQ